MGVRSCHHCGAPVPAGVPHDCWTTTEAALTGDLSDDLREAWERLRETAAEFGDQRIYASHQSIMFSRAACYFFVRPKARLLEICVFLGRTVTAPQVRRAMPASRVKVAHIIHVRHRDEVESPITDWLREAYDVSDSLRTSAPGQPAPTDQEPLPPATTVAPQRATRTTPGTARSGAVTSGAAGRRPPAGRRGATSTTRSVPARGSDSARPAGGRRPRAIAAGSKKARSGDAGRPADARPQGDRPRRRPRARHRER